MPEGRTLSGRQPSPGLYRGERGGYAAEAREVREPPFKARLAATRARRIRRGFL